MAGLIDWEAIEDRVRQPRVPQEFANLNDLVEVALKAYRLPRWEGQKNYVELWVEKDALAGVLAPLAREYHVTMMVNRGYSSQSAMFESGKRFGAAHDSGKVPVLLYLGDMDPSGEDMVRDVEARLKMFGVPVAVVKIALTMEQVEQYNPPPNPAKLTDPRSKDYVEKHGDSSWEVDALPPQVLTKIIQAACNGLVNKKKMKVVTDKEASDKERLKEALANLNGE